MDLRFVNRVFSVRGHEDRKVTPSFLCLADTFLFDFTLYEGGGDLSGCGCSANARETKSAVATLCNRKRIE